MVSVTINALNLIEKSKKIMEILLALVGIVSLSLYITTTIIIFNFRTTRHLILFWLTILINAIVLFSVRAPSE